jgi:glutathione S-transferase
MSDAKIQFWGAGTSRTLRPIWVAEELGLPYELVPIGPRTGETQTADYTRLNPKQKIPAMVDGDFRMSESLAICRYLIENYPNPAIYRPDNPRDRAREDEWCCYIYGEIDETSLYVMRRHRDLAPIYGEAPAAVSSGQAYAQKHLGVVGRQMTDREFVMAGGFGIADVMLMTCLEWAHVYGLELPLVLADYRARVGTRPAYQRATAVNFKTEI